MGVVSRGYGRTTDDSPLLVSEEHTHEEVGMSLCLLSDLHLKRVIVGKSRKKAAKSLFVNLARMSFCRTMVCSTMISAGF